MNKPFTVIVGFEEIRSYLCQKLSNLANASLVGVADLDLAVRTIVETELLGYDFTDDDHVDILFSAVGLSPDLYDWVRTDVSLEMRSHIQETFPAYRTARHLQLEWIDPTSARLELYARKLIHVDPTFPSYDEEDINESEPSEVSTHSQHTNSLTRAIFDPIRRVYIVPDAPGTRRCDYQPPEFDNDEDPSESDGYYSCIDGIIQACVSEPEPIDCTKRSTRGYYANYSRPR